MDLKKLFLVFQDSFEADASTDQTLAEYIAERYEEVRDTQWQMNKFGQEEQEVEGEYKQKLAAIAAARSRVRESCTHPLTTYHPDASGNNDSHTECDICGVEVGRHGIRGYDG